MASERNGPTPKTDEIRPRAVHLLHLAVLACLAFGQQLLDLLARTPEFLVIRGLGPLDIVALALVVCLLPGVLLAAVVGGLRLVSHRGARPVHLVILAVLAALVALQFLKHASWDRYWPAAIVGGGVVAWLYDRRRPLRQFFTLLSPALLVVPLLFLLSGDVRRAMSGQSTGALDLSPSGARSPVVLMVFDEWSFASLLDDDGNLARSRLPNLARFAEQATWMRGATAASDVTELALPAILTGLLPAPDQLPNAAEHPRSLFTLFGDYRIEAVEPVTRLCPPRLNRRLAESGATGRRTSLATDLAVVWLHLVVPVPYDAELPSVSQNWQGFLTGGPTVEEEEEDEAQDFVAAARGALVSRSRGDDFRDFVASMKGDGERVLYFGHFLLPHVPLEYLPSGRRYLNQGPHLPGIYKQKWQEDPWLPVQAFHRYLLQVQYLDRLLGEMFATLEERGLYDRALIVLMADHGASFRPGQNRRLYSPGNAADIAPIPLFVKAPGQSEGRVIDEPTSALDVLPTILDLLDVAPPAALDGRSLAGGAPSESRFLPMITKYAGRFDIEPQTRRRWGDETQRRGQRLRAIYDGREQLPSLALHRDLIGRRVLDLPSAVGPAGQARIDGGSLYHQYDPNGPLSPVWVSGAVIGSADGCCPSLALAVDGRIVATTRTYEPPGGGLRFAALLPEDAMGSETRTIEILKVQGTGRGRNLVSLAGSGEERYHLELAADGTIRAVVGASRTLSMGARIDGYVQRTRVSTDTVSVAGWAVDLERQGLVDEILVFYRGDLVTRGVTSLPREAVVKSLGRDAFLNSGFDLVMPRALTPAVRTHGIRVVAVTRDGGAGELGIFYDRLVESASGETVVSVTDGREIPLGAPGMDGRIEQVLERDGAVWLVGWAADVDGGTPAERVILFVDGHYSSQLRPAVERPEIAERFDESRLLRCGFKAAAASGTPRLLRSGRLRVVAISAQGEALELLLAGS